MTEKWLQERGLTQSIICEKARAIYDDLLISHTLQMKNEKCRVGLK